MEWDENRGGEIYCDGDGNGAVVVVVVMGMDLEKI